MLKDMDHRGQGTSNEHPFFRNTGYMTKSRSNYDQGALQRQPSRDKYPSQVGHHRENAENHGKKEGESNNYVNNPEQQQP